MAEAGSTAAARRRVAAAAAVAVTAALWLFGAVLAGLDGHLAEAVPGVGSVAFAAVGALVIVRRPGNRLGWVFLAAAGLTAVLGVGGAYARHALAVSPPWPAGRFAAWLADLMATPTVGLLAGVLPQWFPAGRALSPRWRWPVAAAFGYMLLAAVGNGLLPQRLESVPALRTRTRSPLPGRCSVR